MGGSRQPRLTRRPTTGSSASGRVSGIGCGGGVSSRRIHLIAWSGDVVLRQLVRPSAGLDSPYGCLTEVDPKARCLIEVGPRCPFVLRWRVCWSASRGGEVGLGRCWCWWRVSEQLDGSWPCWLAVCSTLVRRPGVGGRPGAVAAQALGGPPRVDGLLGVPGGGRHAGPAGRWTGARARGRGVQQPAVGRGAGGPAPGRSTAAPPRTSAASWLASRAPASRSRMRRTTCGSWPARRPRRRPVPAAPQLLGQPALMVACSKRRSVPARHVPARRRRLTEDRRRVERVGGLGPLAGLHPPAAAAAATDRTATRAPRPAPAPPDIRSPPVPGSAPRRGRASMPAPHPSRPGRGAPERAGGAGAGGRTRLAPAAQVGPGSPLEHGAAWRLAPSAAPPPHRAAARCVLEPFALGPAAAGSRRRAARVSASSRLLRLAQPGVLVLKPGQTPAQPARACRPRPVCSPWPPSTRAPKATTATPSLKNPRSQDGAACPWRSPPRSG